MNSMLTSNNIVYALTSTRTRVCCEIQALKARVLTTPKVLEDISVSENYYCIKLFCRLKLWNNFWKSSIMGCKTLKDSKVKKQLFQSKDLGHPGVTKLCTLLCALLLITSFL